MVLESGTPTPPVVPTGEKLFRDRGYKGNFIDILLRGSADPEGIDVNHLQPIDMLKLGANRTIAAGLDVGHEVAGVFQDATTPERVEGGFLQTGRDFLDTALMAFGGSGPQSNQSETDVDTGGNPWQLPLDPDGGVTFPDGSRAFPFEDGSWIDEQGRANSDNMDKTAADLDPLLQKSNDLILMDQQLLDVLESGQLTEEAQFAVAQAREGLVDQMDQLQLDIEKAKYQLNVQDAIFDFQADQIGFDPDLEPLERALEQEGGVGLQTMQAIKDIANTAEMSLDEKNEAVGLILDRASFSKEIVNGISEMVQNRNDLEKLNEMTDVELAANMGVEAFFDPMFPNVIETDPAVRFENNFLNEVENTSVGDWLSEEATDPQYQLFLNIVNQANVLGDARAEELSPLYQSLVTASGRDFGSWQDAVAKGLARAQEGEKSAELAVNATSLKPGSEAMAVAIAQAGQGLVEAGVDPEAIRLISNYAGLHAIIDVKSGGRAGHTGEGTIRGVGGLTEEMYRQLMAREGDDGSWRPDRGMEWELQALLLYIMRGFGGDPMRAMDFYRKTESWGGSQSMGGVDEQVSRQGE